MANKPKIGLDYFPMETDFFGDLKIRKLIKYQSGRAVTVYASLLCNIYKRGYYIKWDEELPFAISEVTGYEEGYINEVIKCCLNVGLFSNKMFQDHKVFTSKGIQERYELICKSLKRKYIISEYICIDSEELNNNSEEKPQKKGKENKEKKRKVFIAPTLIEFENYFLENGFSKDLAGRAWKGYSSADWHDSKGNPVLNWKQKCQNVWFKEENKEKISDKKESVVKSNVEVAKKLVHREWKD